MLKLLKLKKTIFCIKQKNKQKIKRIRKTTIKLNKISELFTFLKKIIN